MDLEFEFTLPKGYLDENGQWHRHGRMRLANVEDEAVALQSPEVQNVPNYYSIIILSRVVTALGNLPVTPQLIRQLFLVDFNFLQDLYIRHNELNYVAVHAECPHCLGKFQLQVAPLL